MTPVVFKARDAGPERWYNALWDEEKNYVYLKSCIGRPDYFGFRINAIDYNSIRIRRHWVVERVVQQIDKKYEELYT